MRPSRDDFQQPASQDVLVEAGEAAERDLRFVEGAEELLGRAMEIGHAIVTRVRATEASRN
jgi:hypothetical protein